MSLEITSLPLCIVNMVSNDTFATSLWCSSAVTVEQSAFRTPLWCDQLQALALPLWRCGMPSCYSGLGNFLHFVFCLVASAAFTFMDCFINLSIWGFAAENGPLSITTLKARRWVGRTMIGKRSGHLTFNLNAFPHPMYAPSFSSTLFSHRLRQRNCEPLVNNYLVFSVAF
jgi:hypothetical protein